MHKLKKVYTQYKFCLKILHWLVIFHWYTQEIHDILEEHVLDKSVCKFKIASLLPHEIKNYKKVIQGN